MPYDVLVSREVREQMRREAEEQVLLDFNAAIDSLMQDPTESNPHVTRISQDYGYDLNEFAISWGTLTLIFEPMSSSVVEIISVQLLR